MDPTTTHPQIGNPAEPLGGVVPSPQAPPPGPDTHHYLIAIPAGMSMHTWLPALDAFPLLLHVRADGDNRETWAATVTDADAAAFLAAAARLGITVQENVEAGAPEADGRV